MAKPIVGQKFGGTSVATSETRKKVVEHIRRTIAEGYQPVIVVSAMGRRGAPYATDTLLDLIHSEGEPVDGRDEDLIFHCGEIISVAIMSHLLKRSGVPAVGLTGYQARVHTDGRFRRGKIVEIDPTRMLGYIEQGVVPVVTGGQGATADLGEVNILGRGASDTSGVAVGVSVGAQKVEIYTDVPGVAIADPRIVPEASFLPEISYRKLYEIGVFGAKVMHPGAVLVGQEAGVPIVCRSTFVEGPGTCITETDNEPPLVGIPALAPVDLVILPQDALQDVFTASDLYDRFEAVVMAGREGETVVGVKLSWRSELDRSLMEAGIHPKQELCDLGLVSLIGRSEFIKASGGQATALLDQHGVEVSFSEQTDIRHTFAIPPEDMSRVIKAFHAEFAE